MDTKDTETALGAMAMPSTFKYRDVIDAGYPEHHEWDPFRLRHPPMPVARRAKLFAPFDALKGFDEAISSKETGYVMKHALDEDEQRALDRKLNILHNYTFNSRMARQNQIIVTVEYFIPHGDETGFCPDLQEGLYEKITGIVLRVDPVKGTITLQAEEGKAVISFEDVLDILPEKEDLFEIDCECVE